MAARFGRNKARRAREALQAERDYSAEVIDSLRLVAIECSDLRVELANTRQALARHCLDLPAYSIGLDPKECRCRMPLPLMVEHALSNFKVSHEQVSHCPAAERVVDSMQSS